MTALFQLKQRVDAAERLWAQGHSALAYEAYGVLFKDIVLDRVRVADFDGNDVLVEQRYADLAAETGHAGEALDLLSVLQRTAHASETRARAAFKRLYLAVEAGVSLIARTAYDSIWRDTGLQPPPLNATEGDLAGWEAGVGWRGSDRAALFSLAYLALGRVSNATRRLKESCVFLLRGIWHADSGGERLARVTAVPLRIALANTYMAMGSLDLSRRALDEAAMAIEEESLARAYVIWINAARAKLSLFAGRFSETLACLEKVQTTAKARSLDHPYWAAVLGTSEVLIIMNQVEEAAAILESARSLASQSGGWVDLQQIARLEFLCTARSGMFQTAKGSIPAPQPRPGQPRLDEIVWTGSCLLDYERREAFVYAALDAEPDDARRHFLALAQDFEDVESPLILARLDALAGLLSARSQDATRASEYLSRARQAFREIGAERELYQTTTQLIFVIEKSQPERYSRLVEENDLRLNTFSSNLTVEQRNAFLLNKYTFLEQKWRRHIEVVLALRDAAHVTSLLRRPVNYWRYWKGLYGFLSALDEEKEKRRKNGDAETVPQRRPGILKLLHRIALHNRRDLTVGYVVLPDRTFVYSLRRWGFDCQSLALGRPQVAQMVLSLRESLFSGGKGTRPFDEQAKLLCQALGLSELLAAAPRRVRHLTVVPDDELVRLPFCALRQQRKDSTSGYLVEDFTLSVDGFALRRPRAPIRLSKAVAGYAVRDLKDAAATSKNAADSMLREWRIECALSDQKGAFLLGVPGASIIYYFGHGHFHPADASQSGLVFRGDEGWGLLSLSELDRIDFRFLDQALILACHGSEARVFPGRWIVSMPEMLLRRGARSVLAGMWLLEQGVAKKISDSFFRDAPVKGRAACIAEVQRGMIAERRDPYTWAGLQVYGESGPIRSVPVRRLWR